MKLRICCNRRPSKSSISCAIEAQTGRMCARCSGRRNDGVSLCRYAHGLPSLDDDFRCSPLLLVSRNMYQDGLNILRPKLGLTFAHIECLLATVSSLRGKRREMLRSIRFYQTFYRYQHHALKGRSSVLDMSRILDAVLSQNLFQPNIRKVMKSQDKKYHMRTYVISIDQSSSGDVEGNTAKKSFQEYSCDRAGAS